MQIGRGPAAVTGDNPANVTVRLRRTEDAGETAPLRFESRCHVMPQSSPHVFPPDQKKGVYQAIFSRRDIRAQFLPDPVPEEVLARILNASHHAPSVGFMQPWDFILIRDPGIRMEIKKAFERAHVEAAQMFDESRRQTYRRFKLEGILESPLNICVTCDRGRFGPVVIGRTAQPVMDLYSSVCAVQNLWLAARAEGVGVGWVSIIHTSDLQRILKLPANVVPVAYLCVGYVSDFPPTPELEASGWLPRLALSDVIRLDGWERGLNGNWPELAKSIAESNGIPMDEWF